MKVSGLDANDDWRFGQGKARYLSKSKAIQQKLKTRLKCFTNDWFLDVDAHIDWYDLLGRKGTSEQIKREVIRVALETEGIATVDSLEMIENRETRKATINLSVTDIFSEKFNIGLAP